MNKLDHDKGFMDIEKGAKTIFGMAAAIWIVSALLSITFTIAVIWGIVQLVQHFTT